jgi:heat shock protein HtpX
VYERAAANRRRTWLLMAMFALLMAAVGWALGVLTGVGPIALVVALLVVGGVSATSYWSSDRIALSMSRAEPASRGEFAQLHNIVEALTLGAGMPKPAVYVVRDPAPNAFATGRDPDHAAIAVTTGLLQLLNRAELEGVLAHELSHVRNRDTLVMTVAVVMVGTIVLVADIFIRSLWWGGLGRGGRGRGGAGGAGALIAVLGIVLLVAAPLIRWRS